MTATLYGAAWSSTINPGTIIALVIAGIAGWFAFKGKQAQNADKRAEQARRDAESFRDNYDVERERSESLQRQLLEQRETFQAQILEQRELKHAAVEEVGRLNMLTDMTNVLKAIADLRAEIAQRFAEFAIALDSFSTSQEAQTDVLRQIAQNLETLNNH